MAGDSVTDFLKLLQKVTTLLPIRIFLLYDSVRELCRNQSINSLTREQINYP